jgi:hypothetical protein
MQRRPTAARPGRDYLGYRVAAPICAEWITVLGQQQSVSLARLPTVSGPQPSRRRVLALGAATVTLLVASPATLSGCIGSVRPPEEPDPLESPARRAEADSALAQAVAQAHPTLTAAASALAADRMAHGTTLHAELRRVRPEPAASTTATAATPTPVVPPLVHPDPADARAALTQALRAAQYEAAGLVLTLPGYRAALLASVTACCATHVALLS